MQFLNTTCCSIGCDFDEPRTFDTVTTATRSDETATVPREKGAGHPFFFARLISSPSVGSRDPRDAFECALQCSTFSSTFRSLAFDRPGDFFLIDPCRSQKARVPFQRD